MSSQNEQKIAAARAAADLVHDGMVIGLGSGSTASLAIEELGRRVAQGLVVRGVPTSQASAELAQRVGVPLTDLAADPRLELTIDGADRFDRSLHLIKGGGGALLREKIVAWCSQRLVIVADESKRSDPLGGFPLPVEVIPFAETPILEIFEQRELRPRLRQVGGVPFVTDEGNHIIDLYLDQIEDPKSLGRSLDSTPGVVEHGLFLGMASQVLVGGAAGVEVVTAS